jgi:hypothetical protein
MATDCTSGSFESNLLCELERAILAIVSGQAQSYAIGSRNFTYQNLNDLMAIRDKVKEQQCGGIFINKATFRDC